MHRTANDRIAQRLKQQLPLPPHPVVQHRRQQSPSTDMSTAGDSDYEHWPSDKKHYTRPAEPAAGYDANNGYHSHAYLVPKPSSVSVAPRADSKSPQPPVISYPQPIYYGFTPAHPGAQQQYHSHPVPIYTASQGYYPAYAVPAPGPATAPDPAPAAIPAAVPAANVHYYWPAAEIPKVEEPAPKANAWIGRTRSQVEEDNMKLAKSENVYAPRDFVPKMDDDQMCWVVELDKTNTLRMFREAKGLIGYWKEDPRFPKSFYFVRTEE